MRRTTLTLDPDVAAMLEEYRRRHDVGLKQAVNDALQRGFRTPREPAAEWEPFETRTKDHGKSLVTGVDAIGELLEALDEHPSR